MVSKCKKIIAIMVLNVHPDVALKKYVVIHFTVTHSVQTINNVHLNHLKDVAVMAIVPKTLYVKVTKL